MNDVFFGPGVCRMSTHPGVCAAMYLDMNSVSYPVSWRDAGPAIPPRSSEVFMAPPVCGRVCLLNTIKPFVEESERFPGFKQLQI